MRLGDSIHYCSVTFFKFSLFFKKDLAFAELGHLIKTLSCATFSKRLNAATNLENEFKMVPRKILCLDIFVQVFIFCLHYSQLFVYFWFDEFFPACWSTRNDCPCSVQDRFEKCKSTEFAADADVPEDMTAAVSNFFLFSVSRKKKWVFIYLFFRVNWEEKKSLVLISERYGDSIPEEVYGED